MWLQTTCERAATPVGSLGKDASKAPVPADFSISPDTWGKPQCGVNTSLTRMHSSRVTFVFPFLTYSALYDSLWVHLRLYKMTEFHSFLGQE